MCGFGLQNVNFILERTERISRKCFLSLALVAWAPVSLSSFPVIEVAVLESRVPPGYDGLLQITTPLNHAVNKLM